MDASSAIRSFVIGSSAPIALPFLHRVSKISEKNYTYEDYSMILPLYFGVTSVIAKYVSTLTSLPFAIVIAVVTILSAIFVAVFALVTNKYDFGDEMPPKEYFCNLIFFHGIAYATIYLLDTII